MANKNEVTPQAQLAALGYILIVVSMITAIILRNGANVDAWMRVIIYTLISTISVYAINCTVVGSCHLYAWVVGYLMVLMGLMVITGLIFSILKN